MQHRWEDRQRTTLRWFLAFTGLGMLIPGVIYLLSWPDKVKAFSLAFGSGWAVWASGLLVIPLVFGGHFLIGPVAETPLCSDRHSDGECVFAAWKPCSSPVVDHDDRSTGDDA